MIPTNKGVVVGCLRNQSGKGGGKEVQNVGGGLVGYKQIVSTRFH